MKVQIDDALSEASKVEKGVPQDSFLGLFSYRRLTESYCILLFIPVR